MYSLTKLDALAHSSVDIDETIMVSSMTDHVPAHDPLQLDETILVSSTTDLAATDNLSRLENTSLTQDLSRLPANHSSVQLQNTSVTPAIAPLEDAPISHNLLGDVSSRNPDGCVQICAGELEALFEQIRQLKAENEASKKIPETLESFTLFSKLPLELRRKVWNQALQVPETFTVVLLDQRGFNGRHSAVTSPVSKSNIMFVNVEARNEAKMVLTQCVRDKSPRLKQLEDGLMPYQDFEVKGKATWFNQNTDIAWFPGFAAWFPYLADVGFPRNHGIDSIAIKYIYWAQYLTSHQRSLVRSHFELRSYFEFGPKRLREIVLVLEAEDLRVKYGNEKITTSSKPADFLLHEADGVPVADFTWDMMGKEEMRKMGLWKKSIIAARQVKINEGWTDDELLLANLPADITVPDISFRLQIETLVFPN